METKGEWRSGSRGWLQPNRRGFDSYFPCVGRQGTPRSSTSMDGLHRPGRVDLHAKAGHDSSSVMRLVHHRVEQEPDLRPLNGRGVQLGK